MLPNALAIRICRVVVFAVLMLATACAPSGPLVKVETPVSAVQVNDTLTVPVKVEKIANLTAIEMHLSFDATLLEVVKVNNGGLIKADFVVQNTFDNAAGTLDYAVAQIGGTPATGSGTLLEVVFRARASGSTPIRFRAMQAAPAGALFSDPNGAAIQVSLTDGTVTVK